jgi:class 3 adenylate cyclase
MSESANSVAQCFVPEILVDFVQRNLEQGKEGIEPASYFLTGVCLLVDISGFTKLSGEFCDRGKSGIDDLQLATNGYMGKLVEVIYTFGGDIIKFAGDAIICVFSPDLITALSFGTIRGSFCGFDGSVKMEPTAPTSSVVMLEVVLRAMHCARTLSEIQTEKLSVHVAISCGEMCFGILGGMENRWECLISGACIHQLSGCLDEAASKEAVISADCAEIIAENIVSMPEAVKGPGMYALDTMSGQYEMVLRTLASGSQKIIEIKCENSLREMAKAMGQSTKQHGSGRNAPRFTELVKRFVPIPIADELEKSVGLNHIAEIREVTTMFMKVSLFYSYYRIFRALTTSCALYCVLVCSGTRTTRNRSTETCWSCSHVSTRRSASSSPPARTCGSSWWTTRAAC